MNLDKMRRQLARTTLAAERAEFDQWLATLTPEHRAAHTNPHALVYADRCLDCGQSLDQPRVPPHWNVEMQTADGSWMTIGTVGSPGFIAALEEAKGLAR